MVARGPWAFLWISPRGLVYGLRGIDDGNKTPGVEAGKKLARVPFQVLRNSERFFKTCLHTYDRCAFILFLERDLDFSVSLDSNLFTRSRRAIRMFSTLLALLDCICHFEGSRSKLAGTFSFLSKASKSATFFLQVCLIRTLSAGTSTGWRTAQTKQLQSRNEIALEGIEQTLRLRDNEAEMSVGYIVVF